MSLLVYLPSYLFNIDSFNLLDVTEIWLQESYSDSPDVLSHGGLHWTYTPRPSGQKDSGVGFILPALNTFKILPTPLFLSLHSFETTYSHLFSISYKYCRDLLACTHTFLMTSLPGNSTFSHLYPSTLGHSW